MRRKNRKRAAGSLDEAICQASRLVEGSLLENHRCESVHNFFHFALGAACHAVTTGDMQRLADQIEGYWQGAEG